MITSYYFAIEYTAGLIPSIVIFFTAAAVRILENFRVNVIENTVLVIVKC